VRLPRYGHTVTSLLAAAVLSSVTLAACGSSTKTTSPTTASPTNASTTTTQAGAHVPTINSKLFAMAPPKATNPDDITMLDGLLYVTYQNNAGKDGTPAGSMSTIVALDPATAKVTTTYSVLGRCDGLTADPSNHRLLASVNEDSSSSLFVITPGNPAPAHYTYSPDPEEKGSDGSNGGTDAISVGPDGTIYVAHSNPDASLPAPNNTAAVFTMTLSGTTATLTPVFGINDTATVVNPASGGPATAPLGLTDPDSNRWVSDLFGGVLIQDAQADSKLVMYSKQDPKLRQLNLTNAPTTKTDPSVTPQLDDIAEVTGAGTLYAVDQATGNIFAITVTAADAGTFFVSQPNPAAGDKPNRPALGVVDIHTGVVTHVDSTFGSPKGLLFVSS
jgi:hypothetical protein